MNTTIPTLVDNLADADPRVNDILLTGNEMRQLTAQIFTILNSHISEDAEYPPVDRDNERKTDRATNSTRSSRQHRKIHASPRNPRAHNRRGGPTL